MSVATSSMINFSHIVSCITEFQHFIHLCIINIFVIVRAESAKSCIMHFSFLILLGNALKKLQFHIFMLRTYTVATTEKSICISDNRENKLQML